MEFRFPPRATIVSTLAAALLVAGCDLSDPRERPVANPRVEMPTAEPGPDPFAGSIDYTETMRIALDRDSITFTLDAPRLYRSCSQYDVGGTTLHQLDVVELARSWGSTWTLSGDTLWVLGAVDTLWDDPSRPTRMQAIFAVGYSFLRVEGSTGIDGTWRRSGPGVRKLWGELPLDSLVSLEAARIVDSFLRHTWTIRDGVLTSTLSFLHAREFYETWDGSMREDDPPGNPWYDLTARVVDAQRLEVIGRQSGEVVTITWSDSGMTYTSSVPGRAPHHYQRETRSCPNSYYPSWWGEFTDANPKRQPAGRIAARPPQAPPGGFPGGGAPYAGASGAHLPFAGR